jgi:anti-sigma B factor antagonist
MVITERDVNNIKILKVEGRIDSQGAVELDTALQSAVENGQYKLVLDMGQVQYINSAALRTLADVITRTRQHDGDLRLAQLTPKVERVLKIVGFDKFSSIYESVDEAVKGF